MRIYSLRLQCRFRRFKFISCYLQQFFLILLFNLQNLYCTAQNLLPATSSKRSHSFAPFAALLEMFRTPVQYLP
jgi:hypothetical protein